jgi:hypothetical protein
LAKSKPATFLPTITDMRDGTLPDDLNDALANVLAHVRATGRKGSLTLTLTIKPASKGSVATLFLDAAIVEKLPKAEHPSSIFYANDHGGLSRRDERQPELSGLRSVEPPTAMVPRSIAAPQTVDRAAAGGEGEGQ